MDNVADALRATQLDEGTRQPHAAWRDLDRARVDKRAPELAEQERRPVSELDQRICQFAGRRSVRRTTDEIGGFIGAQPRERYSPHLVEPRKLGERLGESRSDVFALVA